MYFRTGSIYRFSYDHPRKDASTGDRHKEVLILHPYWNGKTHALDLKRLSPAEREVLQAILEPYDPNVPHRLGIVNSIRARFDARKLIRSPQAFYSTFLKRFLSGKDAYRMYDRKFMSGVTLVKDRDLSGKTVNSKPLFKKPEPSSPASQQPKVVAPMGGNKGAAAMRARFAKPSLGNLKPSLPGPAPLPAGAAQRGVLGTGASNRLAALKARFGKNK